MYNRIVTLGLKTAKEAIKNTDTVMYRHGVWNSYNLAKTEDVMRSIDNSGYGADVYADEKGQLYVSIPSASDMW